MKIEKSIKYMGFMMNVFENMVMKLYGNNLQKYLVIYHFLRLLNHKYNDEIKKYRYFVHMVDYHQQWNQ